MKSKSVPKKEKREAPQKTTKRTQMRIRIMHGGESVHESRLDQRDMVWKTQTRIKSKHQTEYKTKRNEWKRTSSSFFFSFDMILTSMKRSREERVDINDPEGWWWYWCWIDGIPWRGWSKSWTDEFEKGFRSAPDLVDGLLYSRRVPVIQLTTRHTVKYTEGRGDSEPRRRFKVWGGLP